MADQTISSNANHDDLTGRSAGENISIIDGAVLTIDSMPQYTAMGIFGYLNCQYGRVIIDGRNIKEIAYSSGTGTLPSVGDIVTDSGGASGKVIELLSGTATSGVVVITQQSGTFTVSNTISDSGTWSASISSVKVGYLCVMNEYQGGSHTFTGLGTFEARGEWYELGTGDGTDGQTFTMPHVSMQGCVWVETGSGTGVYEKWSRKRSACAFTEFKTGDLGRVFDQPIGSSVLTFGTSTNGGVVPNGAKVRVPNVSISSATLAAQTVEVPQTTFNGSRFWTFNANQAGTYIVDKACFSGTFEFQTGTNRVTATSSSFFTNYQIIARQPTGSVSFSDCGINVSGEVYYNAAFYPCYRVNGASFTDCEFYHGVTVNTSLIFSGSSNVTVDGCRFLIEDGDHSKAIDIRIDSLCKDVSVSGCIDISGGLNVQGIGVTIRNHKFSDNAKGNLIDGAFDKNIVSCSGGDIIIDGVELLSGGAPPFSSFVSAASCSNLKVQNIGSINSKVDLQSHTAYGVVANGTATDILVQRCFFQNSRANNTFGMQAPINGVVFENCSGSYDSQVFTYGLNIQVKGAHGASGAIGTNNGVSDNLINSAGNHFIDVFTSDTTGRLHALFSDVTSETSQYVTTGGATTLFKQDGDLYLLTVGDYIEIESPYEIKGHTGFQNLDVVLAGVNTGNIDAEYAIDTGSGFGAYKSATGTNLSSETISPTGFKFKWRFTCNTSNTGNLIRGAYVSTTTSLSAQSSNFYPLVLDNTASITSNEANSLIQVFTTNTQTLLDSTIGTSLVYTHSGETVDIVVQKAGFLPQRRTGIALSGTVNQSFTLETDFNYNASHGLAYSTDFSYDRGTERLTLTATTASPNDVYSALIDAFIAQASLLNTQFKFSANGVSFYLTDGAEFASDANVSKLTGEGGVRYIDATDTVTAEWCGIITQGVVAGSQVVYEQVNGAGWTNGATTGNLSQQIKIYGDVTHGNFDYRSTLDLKVNRNGYRPAEVDLISTYGLSSISPTSYIVALPMVAIDGLTLGDPTITGVTITEGLVSWDAGDGAKDYTLTITDTGSNTGENILRWVNYFTATVGTFQGKNNYNWPELVLDNGAAFETIRGTLHNGTDSIVGVRVIDGAGDPHPDFTRFQADDGTYGTPPVFSNGSVGNIVAGSKLLIENLTKATETFIGTAGSSYSEDYAEGTTYEAGDSIRVTITYQNGVNAYEAFQATTIATSSGWSVLADQVVWSAHDEWSLDGSTLTATYSADYVDNEIDIKLPANFRIDELGAWWAYNLTTDEGIRNFVGGLTFEDSANILNNVSVVSIKLDNLTSTEIYATDNRRFRRSDGARPVKSPTTGGGGIDVEWREKVLTVNVGSGPLTPQQEAVLNSRASQADVAGVPTNVRAELATELGRIDVATSSRASTIDVINTQALQ